MQDKRSSAVGAHFHCNAGVQLEFTFQHFPRGSIKGSLLQKFHTAFLRKGRTVVYVKIHLCRSVARFLHILIRVFYIEALLVIYFLKLAISVYRSFKECSLPAYTAA